MRYQVTLWQLMGGQKWRRDIEFLATSVAEIYGRLKREGFYVDDPQETEEGIRFSDMGGEYLAEVVEQ